MSASDDWPRLQPDVEHAVAQLLAQLRSGNSPQDLLDSYLYAKRLLAESMQAFIRLEIDEQNSTFHGLRRRLHEEIRDRYAGRVPDRYLKVPYGSRVHEEMFTILLRRKGSPVQSALLRVATADSVHTERRVRELRELGLHIPSSNENGYEAYTLTSLDVDISFVPSIVANLIKKDKRLSKSKVEALLEEVLSQKRKH